MLDRVSKFGNHEIVKLLQEEFIPVAFDQWYQRQQEDHEGEFYRKIASQGPRADFNQTTQGSYVANATGKLFGYNNNYGPDRLLDLLKNGLKQFKEQDKAKNYKTAKIKAGKSDPKKERAIPDGAVVVRVNSKVLGGYERPRKKSQAIFQDAISRDNLWILKEEKAELIAGNLPNKLVQRIIRFHLVDNTRGEPNMWHENEIRDAKFKLDNRGRLTGKFHAETKDGKRGFQGTVFGFVRNDEKLRNKRLVQFDLVARGLHWGSGTYTPGAPEGKYPLAVAFRIAALDGSDVADSVAPQGTKGWLRDYIE